MTRARRQRRARERLKGPKAPNALKRCKHDNQTMAFVACHNKPACTKTSDCPAYCLGQGGWWVCTQCLRSEGSQ